MDKPTAYNNSFLALTKFCAYRERCTQEVVQKMYATNVPKADHEKLLQQLCLEGFLDDSRFANSYVRGKFSIKKWGRNKIKAGLYQKGIPAEIIQKALLEIDEKQYEETIEQLATKKRPTIKGKNELERLYKLKNYLLGRGFEMSYLQNLK